MSEKLRILWTVIPTTAPRPSLSCSRCGVVIAFVPGDKFRVNANGRCIDAWLIYHCSRCGSSWKRPILERQNLRRLDGSFLRALEANDPELVRRFAFDLQGLRRSVGRSEEFAEAELRRRLLSGSVGTARELAIRLVPQMPSELRPDRLLAAGLGLPRSRVQDLHCRGWLHLSEPGHRALRRPLRKPVTLHLDLAALNDGPQVAAAAVVGARADVRGPRKAREHLIPRERKGLRR